jgi:hypothetical protein
MASKETTMMTIEEAKSPKQPKPVLEITVHLMDNGHVAFAPPANAIVKAAVAGLLAAAAKAWDQVPIVDPAAVQPANGWTPPPLTDRGLKRG